MEAGVRTSSTPSVTAADTTSVVLVRAHRPTELAIAASGVPYTFLRNNTYFENDMGTLMMALATGTIATSTRGGRLAPAARGRLRASGSGRSRHEGARRGTKGHEGARRGTKAPFTNSGRRPPTAMRTGPRRSRERAAGTLLTSKSARSRRRLPCRAPGCPLAWSSSSSASTARWLDASSTSRRRTWRSWSSVSRIAVLDEACCVTGVALPIDGGYAIKRTPGDNTFHVVQFWIHGLSSSGANSRPCFSIVYRRSRLPSGSSTTINHACTAVMTGECTMFRCVRNSSH